LKLVRIGIHGSKQACGEVLSCSSAVARSQTSVHTELRATTLLTMPNVVESMLDYAFCCFPHASPVSQTGAGKQKTAPPDRSMILISLRKFGAGEGIRTLDPNLGKVGPRERAIPIGTIGRKCIWAFRCQRHSAEDRGTGLVIPIRTRNRRSKHRSKNPLRTASLA
jgi:hypothetical protein